ncbi:MAG: cadmium-translocating P-type ATPase [Rhizobiales bacterium]|nr:cadmium-translocating P-type ATPase [Hyphomicrobiales bacterium]
MRAPTLPRLEPEERDALLLAAAPATALALGAALWTAGRADLAHWTWMAGVLPVLAALVVSIVRSLAKGDFGLDVIAGFAMAGALATGEALAGCVVALMLSGGQALESYAQRRARHEMTALLGRVPRAASVYVGGRLETRGIEAILPGDRLLIRAGEVLPVDGRLASAGAALDESALTGESLPVDYREGAELDSGATNAGEPFDLVALRPAAESTYAGVVRLVESARRSRAPMSRLADAYALGFLALTAALTALAWALTGDPRRALAVLVVATPCPLILAVPVAVVAGMSRCARRGVLVKSAAVLEALPQVRSLLIDKTGTLTTGRPRLVAVEPAPGVAEVDLVLFAASLAQGSQHPVSAALVDHARRDGLSLAAPTRVSEQAGVGVTGEVAGRLVALGRPDADDGSEPPPPGVLAVAVALDGRPAGRLLLADPVRPEAAQALARLRAEGLARIVLVSGDRADVAEHVGRELGLDAVVSEATPAEKLAAVADARRFGPVMMVGDGVNDAPALAAADVGIAIAARGAAAASEAADVILVADRIDRIGEAIAVARRTREIAVQSVVAGLGLSLAGMVAAAFGFLTPLAGALLQEAIDVAVVLNALRALGGQTPEAAPVAASAPRAAESAAA